MTRKKGLRRFPLSLPTHLEAIKSSKVGQIRSSDLFDQGRNPRDKPHPASRRKLMLTKNSIEGWQRIGPEIIQIYTDGSVCGDKAGAAAVFVETQHENVELWRLSDHTTSLRAELLAIKLAIKNIIPNLRDRGIRNKQIQIISDAKLALKIIAAYDPDDQIAIQIKNAMLYLSSRGATVREALTRQLGGGLVDIMTGQMEVIAVKLVAGLNIFSESAVREYEEFL